MKLPLLLIAAAILAASLTSCVRTVSENGRLIYSGPRHNSPGR